MTDKLRNAAQLALEALLLSYNVNSGHCDAQWSAITALRESCSDTEPAQSGREGERMSPSKEWLETRLAIADDSDVQAGVPSKNARPCDAPPGCDSHNCHGCDDFKHPSPTPQPAPAPLSDDTKRLAWMADEWTPGHEKLYDKHVLETGGVGGLDDLRTFIDKQIAAQEGKT